MSTEADRAIKAVLDEFEEAWTKETVWRVQGTAVISHKALERIAAKAGIHFDLPNVLRAERDESVMLVTGYRGEHSAWSIGECVINQNYRVSGKQAAYPWAMAEKRAKDRVILKLLSLHGFAYSEEEADDVKGQRDAETGPKGATDADDGEARRQYLDSSFRFIAKAPDSIKLKEWWQSDDQRAARKDFELNQSEVDRLKQALTERLAALAGNPFDEAPPPRSTGRDQGRTVVTSGRRAA